MNVSIARIRAVIGRELAEFRRNRLIVTTAVMLPVIFLIGPTAEILSLRASALSATLDKRVDYALFLPLIVPVLVPAIMSAYSVVGEREQGTLEPLLTTPVSRAELLIGKATAIFMPAVVLGYLMFGVFLAITQFAAASPVAAAVRHAPQLPAALMSFHVISPTFGLAAALAGGLLAIDCAACLVVVRLFDRERLITGTRPTRETVLRLTADSRPE